MTQRLLVASMAMSLVIVAGPFTVRASAIEVRGASASDRRMAADLRRYLARNYTEARWYDDVRSISARRGVLTVRTVLRSSRVGRRAAYEICGAIQGSDVADFTPGHTVLGRRCARLRTCPPRAE